MEQRKKDQCVGVYKKKCCRCFLSVGMKKEKMIQRKNGTMKNGTMKKYNKEKRING